MSKIVFDSQKTAADFCRHGKSGRRCVMSCCAILPHLGAYCSLCSSPQT